MTIHDAAPEQPTLLPDLLKARLFLRRDTLKRVSDVVEALIQAQSTCHRRLGTFLPGDVSPEARKKGLQRFFQNQQLTGEVFLDVLLPLLPPGKLVFAMDRTNWEHGTQPLNHLVLVAEREFLGQQRFEFLQRRRIKRCIRVKGGARVDCDCRMGTPGP